MDYIKQKLYATGIKKAELAKKIMKEHGDVVLQQVTIGQVLSGQKGIVGLLTDTSKLDPEEGIRFRGFTPSSAQRLIPFHSVF